MPSNPFFSGRIPPDLFKRAEQHCAETGETKTDILINALSAYLNHPVVRPVANVASPKAEERFKALEERLAVLELSFKRFSHASLLEGVSPQQHALENIVIKTDNK